MYLFNWAKRNTGFVNYKRTFRFCGQKPNCEELSWEYQKSKWRKQRLSHLLQEKRKGKTSGSFTEIKYFVLWMDKWKKSDDVCLEE